MPRLALRSAFALLALALAACDSTSEPDGVAGTYSVRAVNGERPPVTVWGNAVQGYQQVVDADVRLGADGEASVELVMRMVTANGTGPEQRTTYEGTYQQNGDVLTFSFLESDAGLRVSARGVVISGREVAVTLMFAASAYTGFQQYPVSIIARR